MNTFVTSGEELLGVAARILERSGFSVETVVPATADGPWVLAENEFFAIAVLTGSTLSELAVTESLAGELVLERLAVNESAKRWDAYLVLLTPEPSRDADDRERVNLTYNTRGLRRIVGQGLVPTDESVSRVLTPFLPLSSATDAGLEEIDAQLIDALEVNGIDRTRAERYVSAFLSAGNLDNV